MRYGRDTREKHVLGETLTMEGDAVENEREDEVGIGGDGRPELFQIDQQQNARQLN